MEVRDDKLVSTNPSAEEVTIEYLPNELLFSILKYNSCGDLLSFAATCKRFYAVVRDDQTLWKGKFKETMPCGTFEPAAANGVSDWFQELRRMQCIKKQVYAEIVAMSPMYYWRPVDVTLEDVRSVFRLALSNQLSYYFVMYTLKDLIWTSLRNVDNFVCVQPFTLTEYHYGRVTLRHLMHTFLSLRWVRSHLKCELAPKVVLNFFVQWIDTDNIYPDEGVDYEINEIIEKVSVCLEESHKRRYGPPEPSSAKRQYSDREVLAAITYVIYRQLRMGVTTSANLDSLDIVKVLRSKCGVGVTLAVIYHSVAAAFGVKCEVVTFPNHLFLQWEDTSSVHKQVYTLDFKSGEWRPKRRCPFTVSRNSATYTYYPDSLLQYIYTAYHQAMAAIKSWQTQNALFLLDFLSQSNNDFNPYRNFLSYLLDMGHLPGMDIPINIKYLDDSHIELLRSLAYLNTSTRTVNRSAIVKHHDSCIRFAVGMIVSHNVYGYTGLIRGWDPCCAVEWQYKIDNGSLNYGLNQPFYHVIAADQSERYIAQENLSEVSSPSRMYHLEELIAREFTHFNGFAYVPNREKQTEYPQDAKVSRFYRQHHILRNNARTV